MANDVEFIRPVDDDFFAAHAVSRSEFGLYGGTDVTTLYRYDGVGHALGCIEQFQFCGGKAGCTPLAGWNQAVDGFYNMTLTSG